MDINVFDLKKKKKGYLMSPQCQKWENWHLLDWHMVDYSECKQTSQTSRSACLEHAGQLI